MQLEDIDPNHEPVKDGVAHLYSGGSDSSLAACLLAARFPKVYLNTFDRFGFIAAAKLSEVHFERMRLRFPNADFIHQVMDAGRFYEEVESRRRLSFFRKYGILVLNTCGHCKVALHWRNLLFCLKSGISYASDGAIVGAEEFAEQNPRILMPELTALYRHFGVTLLHPVYHEGISTEEALYELGLTDQPKIKMTAKDMQVVCTQQIMFAMMMRRFLANRSFEEYEKLARRYLSEKLEHIKRETEKHLSDPDGDNLVSRMLR